MAISLLVAGPGIADPLRLPPHEEVPVAAHDSAALIAAARPAQRIHCSNLDAVTHVSNRAAITAAIREAVPRDQRRVHAAFDEDGNYRRPKSPRAVAEVFADYYGPDSILTRSANAVAALADAAEKRTQAPLDRVEAVTDAIVDGTRKIPGLERIPDFKLKSKVSNTKASVTLSTSW